MRPLVEDQEPLASFGPTKKIDPHLKASLVDPQTGRLLPVGNNTSYRQKSDIRQSMTSNTVSVFYPHQSDKTGNKVSLRMSPPQQQQSNSNSHHQRSGGSSNTGTSYSGNSLIQHQQNLLNRFGNNPKDQTALKKFLESIFI